MRCLLASESEENDMASDDAYFEILGNIVASALESIQDGEDVDRAIGDAIDSECMWDVDRQTVAENFGTLDIEAAFNNAYEDLYGDVYNRVMDEIPDDEEDEDEEDEE